MGRQIGRNACTRGRSLMVTTEPDDNDTSMIISPIPKGQCNALKSGFDAWIDSGMASYLFLHRVMALNNWH